MKAGSEILGTQIFTLEEGMLYIKTAQENGSDLETAAADMALIDDCLTMQRMVRTYGSRKDMIYTEKGRIRKNVNYFEFINNRIDQLIEESKSEQ